MEYDLEGRLKQLRDELVEIRDGGFKPYSFGIITCSAKVHLPHSGCWKFLEPFIKEQPEDEALRLRPNPWLEPFSDGSACVWWWGDLDGINAYRKWADRARPILEKAPAFADEIIAKRTYHYVLGAIITFAKQDATRARSVVRRELANLGSDPLRLRRSGAPVSLLDYEPPLTFTFDEVTDWAARFTVKVMNAIVEPLTQVAPGSADVGKDAPSEKPAPTPRLKVDLRNERVTLDGVTYGLDLVYVLILDGLLKAHGVPITRSWLQEQYAELALEDRLDRRIDKLRKARSGLPFAIPIQSSKKGYSLPQEYLSSEVSRTDDEH